MTEVPQLADMQVDAAAAAEALGQTVLIKRWARRSMGLDGPKTLLPVRGGKNFLDLLVGQVLAAREATGARVPLLFMNSFRTP